MKKHLWIIIIVLLAVAIITIFFADDIKILFLPEGGPSERPIK